MSIGSVYPETAEIYVREHTALSTGSCALQQGRQGNALDTLRIDGQMLQRVVPVAVSMKNILLISYEVHRFYWEKPQYQDLGGDYKNEPRSTTGSSFTNSVLDT